MRLQRGAGRGEPLRPRADAREKALDLGLRGLVQRAEGALRRLKTLRPSAIGPNDLMTVKVEVEKPFFDGELKQLEQLRRQIVDELKGDILITPKVDLVEPGSLPSSEGKAVRVIDNRKD